MIHSDAFTTSMRGRVIRVARNMGISMLSILRKSKMMRKMIKMKIKMKIKLGGAKILTMYILVNTRVI